MQPGCSQLRLRAALLASLALSIAACGDPATRDGGIDASPDAAPRAMWPCPSDWVPAAVGGCGPAVVLCVADGGAAAGACDGVDVSMRRGRVDADGGSGVALYRAPTGAYAGGWHEDDDPDGYPPVDWTPDAGNGSSGGTWAPDAGVSSCPAGWTMRADGTCDPTLRNDCPALSGPLPGGMCTATDASRCPSTPYADPSVAGVVGTSRVVHVAADGDPTVADGSIAHPFATIAQGIAAAGASGFVLVAAGTYDESLSIAGSVTLVGVCAANVVVHSADGSDVLGASGPSTTAVVHGMRFEGGGVRVSDGASLSLAECIVRDMNDIAARADGPVTHLGGHDVFFQNIAPRAPATRGLALSSTGGAEIDLSRVAIDSATESAAFAGDAGSTLRLVDSSIVSTRLGDPAHQATVSAHGNASLTLDRVALPDNPIVGVSVVDSSLELTDSTITHVTAGARAAFGLVATNGDVHVRGVSVRDVEGDAIGGRNTRFDIRDSIVVHAEIGSGSDADGSGVLTIGGHVHLERTRIRDARAFGVLLGYASRTDTSTSAEIIDSQFDSTGAIPLDASSIGIASLGLHPMTLTNTVVREPVIVGVTLLGSSDAVIDRLVVQKVGQVDRLGFDLMVAEGSRARATDVSVSDSFAQAIMVQSPNAHLDLDHAFVGRIHPAFIDATTVSVGIFVVNEATAVVRHTRIQDVPVLGLSVSQTDKSMSGTSCELYDSAVLDVFPAPGTPARSSLAAALGAALGGSLSAERIRVESNGPMGAMAGGGGQLVLRDSIVRDTRSLGDGYASAGLFAYENGWLEADRVVVERSNNTGVIAWGQGHIALTDVIVDSVAPDVLGYGNGINASGDGIVELDRVAVLSTNGAAMMAAPFQDPLVPRTTGARMFARDLFVRGVARQTIRTQYDDLGNPTPDGIRVAYGVHAGAMCEMDVERGVLVDADYGFVLSSGAMSLTDVVIASMAESAGAQSGTVSQLSRVNYVANHSDATVTSADLPEGAMLRTPQSSCANPGCL